MNAAAFKVSKRSTTRNNPLAKFWGGPNEYWKTLVEAFGIVLSGYIRTIFKERKPLVTRSHILQHNFSLVNTMLRHTIPRSQLG